MKNKTITRELAKEQYYILTELLDTITWQIRGDCEDIDCNKYIYKNELKKFHPVLDHKISCIPVLKRQKAAIFHLLGDKKFKQYRYEPCDVCKKQLDTLDDNNKLTTFSSKKPSGKTTFYQMLSYRTHKTCKKKLSIPEGFEKFP